eukprot:CAMPEP_0117664794 /NCGR_PEP_ID=MMETSP0804-20121206/9431_1 /TAXON_ID=1074897 /ORGANISM="Tetraselmis astigmatica, Strain CCMP880" /LENGTH=312 /DNA_ID=CAMNT_0005472093 /DNA_START=607 /DNA_END=1545 /DNA_ORIENTATION=+
MSSTADPQPRGFAGGQSHGRGRWRTSSSQSSSSSSCQALAGEGATPSSGTAGDLKAGRALVVLGGNGFVGGEIVRAAALAGYDIISVSRRGAPADATAGVAWEKGDLVADPGLVGRVLDGARARGQRVVGMVHAVGMLLESDANALASGSGSVPATGTTYDQLTRETALRAAEAWMTANREQQTAFPFVFVSAAEAGWTESLGGDPLFTPDFLQRYLKAKRDVEKALLEYATEGALRPVILRPSLVFSKERLPSLPAVGAFYIGHAIGLPGIDRPVLVSTLAAAAVAALKDDSVYGVQGFQEMEELAARRTN